MKKNVERKLFQPVFIIAFLFFAGSVSGGSTLAEDWQSAKWNSPKDRAKWQSIDNSDELSTAEGNYQLYCSSCHGARGDGNGDLAETLEVPPRDHTDASIMSKRTDRHIFKTISEGGKANGFDENMPPHKTVISKKDINGLVKYIRKLCRCKYKEK